MSLEEEQVVEEVNNNYMKRILLLKVSKNEKS